jgi:hypothetical protein
MAKRTDWLPQGHEVLQSKAQLTFHYLSDPMNRDRMGFDPMSPYGHWLDMEFTPKYSAFSAAVDNWKDPAERTKIKTDVMLAAQKVFMPAYRQLYTGMLKGNPLVTDADLDAMDLPKHGSGGGGHNPPPTSFVETEVLLPGPGILEFHYHNAGSENKAKPDGVHGAEFVWEILAAPTNEWSDLTHSAFDTHTPLTLRFEGHDRGKTLYFAMRWENTTGEKGPWSPIQNTIIP